jgi:hypothetical protein
MNRLTDSIREDPEKIGIHLKTAPEKRFEVCFGHCFTPTDTEAY